MLDKHFTEIQGTLGRSYSILEHIYKEFFFYSELEDKVSRACLKFNFDKSKRYEVIVIDKKRCGFVIKTLYGLHYVCILAMKIRNEMPIQLDEINHHRQM